MELFDFPAQWLCVSLFFTFHKLVWQLVQASGAQCIWLAGTLGSHQPGIVGWRVYNHPCTLENKGIGVLQARWLWQGDRDTLHQPYRSLPLLPLRSVVFAWVKS